MKKLINILIVLLFIPALAAAQPCRKEGANVRCEADSGGVVELIVNGSTILSGDSTGLTSDLDLGTSGKTLILEDGTAASSCIGTGTLTAATAVQVSTTCIETGDYVFVTRTSDDTDGTGNMWVDNIVDGTYFEVTSETSDTATFNWVIIKGQ